MSETNSKKKKNEGPDETSKEQQAEETLAKVDVATDNDVLCGKDKSLNNHPGNRQFREVICSYAAEYNLAEGKPRRTVMTKEIMDDLVKRYKCRFLRPIMDQDGVVLHYREISTAHARDKIGHSLRFHGKGMLAKKQKEQNLNSESASNADRRAAMDWINATATRVRRNGIQDAIPAASRRKLAVAAAVADSEPPGRDPFFSTLGKRKRLSKPLGQKESEPELRRQQKFCAAHTNAERKIHAMNNMKLLAAAAAAANTEDPPTKSDEGADNSSAVQQSTTDEPPPQSAPQQRVYAYRQQHPALTAKDLVLKARMLQQQHLLANSFQKRKREEAERRLSRAATAATVVSPEVYAAARSAVYPTATTQRLSPLATATAAAAAHGLTVVGTSAATAASSPPPPLINSQQQRHAAALERRQQLLKQVAAESAAAGQAAAPPVPEGPVSSSSEVAASRVLSEGSLDEGDPVSKEEPMAAEPAREQEQEDEEEAIDDSGAVPHDDDVQDEQRGARPDEIVSAVAVQDDLRTAPVENRPLPQGVKEEATKAVAQAGTPHHQDDPATTPPPRTVLVADARQGPVTPAAASKVLLVPPVSSPPAPADTATTGAVAAATKAQNAQDDQAKTQPAPAPAPKVLVTASAAAQDPSAACAAKVIVIPVSPSAPRRNHHTSCQRRPAVFHQSGLCCCRRPCLHLRSPLL